MKPNETKDSKQSKQKFFSILMLTFICVKLFIYKYLSHIVVPLLERKQCDITNIVTDIVFVTDIAFLLRFIIRCPQVRTHYY